MSNILWKPDSDSIEKTHMHHFMRYVNNRFKQQHQSYSELHRWSVETPADFWQAILDYCHIKISKPATSVHTRISNMQQCRWFDDAKLNFADNLLPQQNDQIAIIAITENAQRQSLTFTELYHQVILLAQYLQSLGVKAGDRIVGFLPNNIYPVVAMLAASWLGAIWSSCSADFGLQGLLDRFGQIEPTVLFATDEHYYQGKNFQHLEKIATLQNQLPTLKKTIITPYNHNSQPDLTKLNNSILWQTILNKNPLNSKSTTFDAVQLSFNDPLYILYSSGTTGKPKCMVHGIGGTLIQHKKELMLHVNLHPEDKIFFYTTCGWMMWNWLVSSLSIGATLVLFDGSPIYPKNDILFDLVDELGITVFGAGAKYYESVAKTKVTPQKTHHLKSLKTLLSTGSPLLPNTFDYLYQNVKKNMCLSSISGGSDIISCFALGNPILPVYRGEIQCIGLGMDVKVFNEQGKSVSQQKGELVCTSPFPSQPIYFWNDPDNSKYHNAYFNKYNNVWAHGDYAKITEHHGLIIYGRSDATLNPSGVRIGTAEIYHQVEKFPQIVDCLAVGQQYDGNERIVLFVIMKKDITLQQELIEEIKTMIKKNASPMHVPAKIIAVPDLPRTISGKLVEVAVKKMIHNQPIKNVEALANPESLDYFKNIAELKN